MAGPIFIVGSSRSGTELIRSILNNSEAIYISNETHYFDDLRPRLKHPDKGCDADERRFVVKYFHALNQHAYGFHRSPETELHDVLSSNRIQQTFGLANVDLETSMSADRIFEDYCRSKAPVRRAVWGEKTPRHVFRLNDIKRVYPAARIIFCHRDPRGVVASYRDWKNRWFEEQILDKGAEIRIKGEEDRVKKSYSILVQCLMWNGAIRSALSAKKTYGTDYIHFLKFEDLLCHPYATVETLCAWLGTPYSSQMLDVMMVNSSYTQAGTVRGISHEPSRRWATKLSEKEVGLIEMATATKMRVLNYDFSLAKKDYIYSIKQILLLPFHILRALFVNRHRISNICEYLLSRATGVSK